MGKGFSMAVARRLWRLVELMRVGCTRETIIGNLNCSPRNLSADVARLKKLGWTVKCGRADGRYQLNFPDLEVVSLKLSPEEFFYVSYLTAAGGGDALANLTGKLALAASEQTMPVYDRGPSYGAARMSSQLQNSLNLCREGILKQRKLAFVYRGMGEGKAEAIRIVHPYHVIHTPNSWYLIAWCEERRDFRRFKLARAETLTLMKDSFTRRKFDLREFLGDAWWLRFDPKRLDNPYQIEVRFSGEAAQSIKEYNCHPTQKIVDGENGTTTLTCKLSYLDEFATWLMQWLGEIEIVDPPELTALIAGRISAFTARHRGTAQ